MTMKKKFLYALLLIVIVAPYIGFFCLQNWYKDQLAMIHNASFLLISKEDMSLRRIDYKGVVLDSFPIACGKSYGNKQKQGDMKTPEGVFHISEIQDASGWTHDFKDGKGEIEGAYGPCFIRLETPGHKGIGIHGTHLPESIGTRATEGCIRLNNNDVAKLKEHVHSGMVVIITPSENDASINN